MSLLTANVKPMNDAESINKGIRYAMVNVAFTALSAVFFGLYAESLRGQHGSFAPYFVVIWCVFTIMWGFRTHRSIRRLASGKVDR